MQHTPLSDAPVFQTLGIVILREAVLTSGRKLRTYSGWELLRAFARIGLAGRAGVKDRSRLGIWYDRRRSDPTRPS